MKNRKINIFVALTLGLMIAFAGCKKDDGGIRSSVVIKSVPVVSTKIESTGSQAIDLLNLAGFSGKFKVELYFPGATPPDKVDIVVRKNGSNANVKVVKKDVTTLPYSLTVTSADITALFGVAVALGDTYDFAPDLYVGVNKYEAFPTTGTGNGAGVIAYPLYSDYARFAAICAYDPAIYEGDFVVVSDAFGDFSPGEVVKFTKISNNSFSFIDPYVTSPLPIIVTINTLNNQATIAKQKIGNQFVWASYTNPNVAVAASSTSVVAPCSKTITLAIAYTVDQGSFGTYNLVLKKKP
ncbi:MAG: hypothetical protein EBU05_00330 [Chitinophagia bacterium]|jgi:hypothetical protein|nr:hypothetical protein [Chitinophagia bacterium]